jgi:hypothetical protein
VEFAAEPEGDVEEAGEGGWVLLAWVLMGVVMAMLLGGWREGGFTYNYCDLRWY